MLESFRYFFYGCPEVGQPDCIYALYQPVADCFLICTTSWRTANKLKMLLSSRYSLHIVEITKAQNYQHNLIDNTVCENWSFADRNLLNINSLPSHDAPVLARTLCQSTQSTPVDWIEEKKYAMMCAHWIEHFPPNLVKKFEINLAKLLGQSAPPVTQDLTKAQVMQLLYLGRDLDQTEQEILKIVHDRT